MQSQQEMQVGRDDPEFEDPRAFLDRRRTDHAIQQLSYSQLDQGCPFEGSPCQVHEQPVSHAAHGATSHSGVRIIQPRGWTRFRVAAARVNSRLGEGEG